MFAIGWMTGPGIAQADPVKIVALGDSLSAGYLLPANDAFPAKLEAALKKNGHEVTIVNAGVSGDTSNGGLARLDWSVPSDADGVILELGANDALRGINPEQTRAALEEIAKKLQGRNVKLLIAGMLAPPNLGETYAGAFNPIFKDLSEKYDAVYYPFFLDGVAAVPSLNLQDGMHPTAEGVDVIVERILPSVEQLIEKIEPTS
ncbi:MAG: arylesterase [Stappiaceae bacterium]